MKLKHKKKKLFTFYIHVWNMCKILVMNHDALSWYEPKYFYALQFSKNQHSFSAIEYRS